jgi:hypothetical protein
MVSSSVNDKLSPMVSSSVNDKLSRPPYLLLTEAYKKMAQAGYRPAAPSDGFGNITVPVVELDLEAEADAYARDFLKEENSQRFTVGCPDYGDGPALAYTVEAARLINGQAPAVALKMLSLASEDLRARYQRKDKEVPEAEAAGSGRTYVVLASLDGQVATVKIGHADDPAKRLRELQTGNPCKLELLAILPNHGQTAERALHKKFARYATGGGREWFALPLATLEAVTGRSDPDDPVPHYRHVTDTGFKVELYHPAELLKQPGVRGKGRGPTRQELEELNWALANRYFRMGWHTCAHALYLSECTKRGAPCVPGGDHESVWVPDPATIIKSDTDGCAPFVLDQPYGLSDQEREDSRQYADAFGLSICGSKYGDYYDSWHAEEIRTRRFWPEHRIVPLEHLLMRHPPAPAEWPDYTQEVAPAWRSEYALMLRGERYPTSPIGWYPWAGWVSVA